MKADRVAVELNLETSSPTAAFSLPVVLKASANWPNAAFYDTVLASSFAAALEMIREGRLEAHQHPAAEVDRHDDVAPPRAPGGETGRGLPTLDKPGQRFGWITTIGCWIGRNTPTSGRTSGPTCCR